MIVYHVFSTFAKSGRWQMISKIMSTHFLQIHFYGCAGACLFVLGIHGTAIAFAVQHVIYEMYNMLNRLSYYCSCKNSGNLPEYDKIIDKITLKHRRQNKWEKIIETYCDVLLWIIYHCIKSGAFSQHECSDSVCDKLSHSFVSLKQSMRFHTVRLKRLVKECLFFVD